MFHGVGLFPPLHLSLSSYMIMNTVEFLISKADLSIGFFDMSVTDVPVRKKDLPIEYEISTLSRVFDETTLKLYLTQVFTDINNNKSLDKSAKKKLASLDPSKYGIDYMLGFHFLPQTVPTGNNKRKVMVNVPIARPRKMVESNLPSQRDYGFNSKEKHVVFSNKIHRITVFPAILPNSGIRHSLKGNLRKTDDTRLSLIKKHGFTNVSGKSYRRLSEVDTHAVPIETKADHQQLTDLGYSIVQLEQVDGFYGENKDGTISNNLQSNKSALGFDPNKFKNTKTKISWGGGTKEGTYLDDYYAFASRYYKFSEFTTKKVRFLIANGRSVYYQVNNQPPKSLATFVEFEGKTVLKINDALEINSKNSELSLVWERAIRWAEKLVNRGANVKPTDYKQEIKQQKAKARGLSKSAKRNLEKFRRLTK